MEVWEANASRIKQLISSAFAVGDWTARANVPALKTDVSQPIEAFQWARECTDLIESVLRNKPILPNENETDAAELFGSLAWTLRVVYETLECLLELQHEQVEQESREIRPDVGRLRSLREGVDDSTNYLSRAISFERQLKLCLALSAQVKSGFHLESLENKNAELSNSLQTRMGPCCLSLIASGVEHGGNVNQWHSGLSMNRLCFTQKTNYDDTTQLLSIALYASLNGMIGTNDEVNEIIRVARSVAQRSEMPTSLANAVAAFWMIDNQVHLKDATELLCSVQLGEIFPAVKSQLTHFQIMEVLLEGNDERVLACQLLDTSLPSEVLPSTLPEAQTLIRVLLAVDAWERSLLKIRDLCDSNDINVFTMEGYSRDQWQRSLLTLVFDYFLLEPSRSRQLLDLVLNKRETDILCKYLESQIEVVHDTSIDQEEQLRRCDVAAVVLTTRHLVNGHIGLAAACHRRHAEAIRGIGGTKEDWKRRELVKRFMEKLPPHIGPDSAFLPLFGKATDFMAHRNHRYSNNTAEAKRHSKSLAMAAPPTLNESKADSNSDQMRNPFMKYNNGKVEHQQRLTRDTVTFSVGNTLFDDTNMKENRLDGDQFSKLHETSPADSPVQATSRFKKLTIKHSKMRNM